MSAFEILTGRALNPGAGPVAFTNNTGDTFQVRSTPVDNGPSLIGMWAQNATGGFIRVRSPRLHDATQGIRNTVPAASIRNLFPDGSSTPLFSQDPLIFETSGGGAETDVGCLAVYYPDLGGINARLATWSQIQPMIKEMTTIEVAVGAVTTAGDWSPGTAINTTNDLLKANLDYAILGYTSSVPVAAVAIRGADTGNMRVGGPGTTELVETRDWFKSLSQELGVGMIPVINQANRAATLAFVCAATAIGATIDFIVAELASPYTG